jgi:hypothetical protein
MSDVGPEASGQSGSGSKPGSESSGSGSKPGSESSGTTFTQERVESFVAEAVRRERAKFADYDEVKQRLADLESAGQSELEKANSRAQEAASSAQKAITRANALLVRSALTAEAARAGAVDPDVVVALLSDQFTVKDDAVEGDVGKAVAKLLEQRPYLRSNGALRGVGSADAGRHTPPGRQPTETPAQRMDEVLRGAR